MTQELASLLEKYGFALYPKSLRRVNKDAQLFVAKREAKKFVGVLQTREILRLSASALPTAVKTTPGDSLSLHELTWENYCKLRDVLPISPSPCDKSASFGTGDRLGL